MERGKYMLKLSVVERRNIMKQRANDRWSKATVEERKEVGQFLVKTRKKIIN